MIRPRCISCRKELEDFGAILLSPPAPEGDLVIKSHICTECYEKLYRPLAEECIYSLKKPAIDRIQTSCGNQVSLATVECDAWKYCPWCRKEISVR